MQSKILFVLLVLLTGCASTPEEPPFSLEYQFNAQVDFSDYRSWAWVSHNPMVVAEDSDKRPDPVVELRLMELIEETLESMGYVQTDQPLQSDFVVGFTVGAREKLDIESYPAPKGFERWQRPLGWKPGDIYSPEPTRKVQYTEGTLAIDVFDVGFQRPVWHGSIQSVIGSQAQLVTAYSERQAVIEILQNFPPE